MSSTVTASARKYTAPNGEYHSIADAAWNSPTGSWYQACWVKFDSTVASQTLWQKQSAGDLGYMTLFDSGTSKIYQYQSGNGSSWVTAIHGTAISSGVWYFIEGGYDSVNQVVFVNINRGTEVQTAQTGGQFDSGQTLFFGDGSGGALGAAVGPRLFTSGVPTAAERDALYNSGNGVLWKDAPSFSAATVLGWWDGAETSGMLLDASGNSRNWTDNNTVTSAAGKVTYTAEDASQFTAANSEYLSIASNPSLQTGDIDFSFAGWVYIDSLATYRILLPTKWGSSGGTREYTLEFDTPDDFGWYVSNNGTATVGVVATAPVVEASKWYFLTCWHDSVNNVIGIRVNDQQTFTTAHTTGVYSGTQAFTPGNAATFYASGRMTNWSFWKKVLSASEITQLYNRGFGLDYSDYDAGLLTNLISSWPLTESSGTRFDVHGSNDLTDNNTVTGNPGVVYDVPTPVVASGIKSNKLSIGLRIGI